jgi:hypothetical protein
MKKIIHDCSTGETAEVEVILSELEARQKIADVELAQRASADARRAKLHALASGAVGKRVQDLTAKEMTALQIVRLERAGALDDDLRIRPLEAWA